MLKPEKLSFQAHLAWYQPPSGGCVLKPVINPLKIKRYAQPPSGGCVLKLFKEYNVSSGFMPSRLQAAVC